MVLSYDYDKQKNRRRRMNAPPLQSQAFQWSCGGIEAVHAALPDAALPGLYWKPLDDATIGRQMAPYHPGGCQGDCKQNEGAKCVHSADHFDGHCGASVLYRVHCLMEEVRGFHISP